GQTRTETKTRPIVMGGETIPRDFTVRTDEPLQLCGSNTQANPQEVLFAALNACM
ncbi:MAG: OsmC family peroxiredoxin, partial [Nitrospinaceae bacterium]|nr:OsmC family peroxiredoxin [Nitrospinaceae bacterium]